MRGVDAVMVTDPWGQTATVLVSEIAAFGMRETDGKPVGVLWMRGHSVMFYCTREQLEQVRDACGWVVNP